MFILSNIIIEQILKKTISLNICTRKKREINRAIFNLKTYSIVFYNAPSVIRNTSINNKEIYDFWNLILDGYPTIKNIIHIFKTLTVTAGSLVCSTTFMLRNILTNNIANLSTSPILNSVSFNLLRLLNIIFPSVVTAFPEK